MSTRHKREYYYVKYVGSCPVCGKDASYKERVYGKKPKDLSKTYVQLSDQKSYCQCLERAAINYV